MLTPFCSGAAWPWPGMQIKFYCQGNLAAGLALLSRAAAAQHADALYSLAVIEFNGSTSTSSSR